jgi:hypothetical protein
MSEKVNKFLTVVGSMWGKRHESEESGLEWFKSWIFALDQYDAWVLDAAARRIVDERKDEYFPKPYEVHQVCRIILAEDRQKKPTLSQTKDHNSNPYKLAHELIQCALGRRAAREGWALTLRDFIAKEGRLPADGEIKKLITIRDKFQEDLIACIDGNGGLFGAPLAKLGRSMAKREYEIAQKVLGPTAEDWYAGRL